MSLEPLPTRLKEDIGLRNLIFTDKNKIEIKLFKWVCNYKVPRVNLIMNPTCLENQTNTLTPISI